MPYLKSVLDVYEFVLQKSTNYNNNAAIKAKQEIIHGLGNTSKNMIKVLVFNVLILN